MSEATQLVGGQWWYRFMYGVGFKPWEQDSATVGQQLDSLVPPTRVGAPDRERFATR